MRRLLEDGLALKGGAAALLALALLFALASAATGAFADLAESGGGQQEAEGDDAPATTLRNVDDALRLGHVSVECMGNGPFSEEELAMGVPQEQTYRIANQGEAAYVRLESRTLLNELSHVNGIAVVEEAADGDAEDDNGAAESAEEDGQESAAPSDPLWLLEPDGFWYRTQPLEAGQVVTVRVSIEIPFDESWTAELSTGAPSSVMETLQVEALQARNVAVDFESDDPWGTGQTGAETPDGAEDAAGADGQQPPNGDGDGEEGAVEGADGSETEEPDEVRS